MANSTSGGGRDKITVADRRVVAGFIFGFDAFDLVHEHFDGRALPVAGWIYTALAVLVTRDNGGRAVDATRREVADAAGISRKALDDYVPKLEEAGLLRVERHDQGNGSHAPSTWLLGPFADPDLAPPVAGHRDDPVHSSSTSSQMNTNGGGGAGGGRDSAAERVAAFREGIGYVSEEVEGIPADMRADAEELLRRKTKVDGRIVQPVEMAKATAALAAFNRLAGSDLGVGANLRNIVMRIRERPSWDVAKHVRLVESAFRIKWWERSSGRRRGRLTPAVIYGNERVFEAVAEDAKDEASGDATKVEARRGKFDRKVTR